MLRLQRLRVHFPPWLPLIRTIAAVNEGISSLIHLYPLTTIGSHNFALNTADWGSLTEMASWGHNLFFHFHEPGGQSR